MPQADSNEIPYNTSDRTNFPISISRRSLMEGNSTTGRRFMYFWVVAAFVLVIVTVIIIKNKADGEKGFVSRSKPFDQTSNRIASKTAWLNSYSSGLALARQEGMMQMLYFTADWCGWCKKMEKESFSNKEVRGLLDQFIKVKIDGDKEKQMVQKFGIRGYPTLVFTDSEGEVIEKIVGFLPANALGQKIRALLERSEKPGQGGGIQGLAGSSQQDSVDVKEDQEIRETSQEKDAQAEEVQRPAYKDSNPNHYHEQAHTYEKQGDYEKAAEFFGKAIAMDPDNWKHRRCFSGLLTRMGEFAEAVIQLEKASELNPKDPEIFHQLGHALWRVKDYLRSIEAFNKAIALSQGNKQYFACAARAYYDLGLMESDTKRSEVYLRTALNLINKVTLDANTSDHVRDLKFQINRAYGHVVRKNQSLP